MPRPRSMPMPVSGHDVLTAARYSLYHDVANALSDSPREAYARKRIQRALWLEPPSTSHTDEPTTLDQPHNAPAEPL